MYLGPQDSDTKKSRHESTYNIYDETLNIQLKMLRIRVILHVHQCISLDTPHF